MPTPTDLVTDLPADFEVFGQAVDSSMADLLGGTTGQILAKNSNTNMDFVWITNDQGDITGITASSPLTGGGTSGAVTIGIQDGTTAQKGAVQLENSTSSTSTTTAAVPASVKSAYDLADGAIAKTIVDAKGDLIAATAADTVSRLAVGANGTVLQADSTTATGLKWAASPSAMTLIASTTFSAVATQNFDSVFSSTYKSYLVVIDSLFSSSSGNDLLLAFRYSGSTQSALYYGSSVAGSYNSTSVSCLPTDNASALSIANASASTGDKGNGFFYISLVDEKPNVNGAFYASVTATTNFFAGGTTQSRTYDGFQLTAGGANLTGRVSIYGLAV